jgi:molecular chaperone GrpE
VSEASRDDVPRAQGPNPTPGPGDLDDEVVEAELLDDEPADGGAPGSSDPGAPAATDADTPEGADGDVPDAEPEGSELEGDDDLDAAAEAMQVDLELLLSEREEFLEHYRRTKADFENYRKQSQKRQDDALVRALGGLVEGLLPVLDACDAALAHGAGEQVEPVVTALYAALEKEGLERIDPAGGAFDPAEAEAVMHAPGDGGAQVVAETLRAGYRWRGRVLRPAMVKVTD